ncbi:MAG: hypothetical protein ACI8UZ_003546, partial [Akkermansiaceae bacterium]
AGAAQRDPLHYDSHPYPSMLRFAKHLALYFDAPRTRHSYYRHKNMPDMFFFRKASPPESAESKSFQIPPRAQVRQTAS